MTTIYLPNYRANQLLKQAALDVNDSLRYAQSLSLSLRGDDTNYYVWDLDPELPQVVISDENDNELKRISYDDDNHQLMTIDADFSPLYFQAKTGSIYSDVALSTRAQGEIKVIHSQLADDGRRYYSIEIYNNSFNLESKILGEGTNND